MEIVKVLHGVNLDSEHRVVVERVKVLMTKWQMGERMKVIKVEALKEQAKKVECMGKTCEKLENWKETNVGFEKVIKQAAE